MQSILPRITKALCTKSVVQEQDVGVKDGLCLCLIHCSPQENGPNTCPERGVKPGRGRGNEKASAGVRLHSRGPELALAVSRLFSDAT